MNITVNFKAFQKFTKDDLKVGYVVKTGNGPYMVMKKANGTTVLVNERRRWMELNSFDNNLNYVDSGDAKEHTITEVYGYNKYGHLSAVISTNDRELLWKREDAKKMTVEEIEKELGYKIEIISEDNKG